MRIICPWVTLHPETKAALEADGQTPEYAYVGRSPEAYHDLLEQVWRRGNGFLVVEHDIVVTPGVLRQLWECACDWGGRAYSIGTAYDSYLGCAKFSDALVGGNPGVFDAVANLRPDGTPKRYWGRLDTRLKQVLENMGQTMHIHWPAVDHLNPDKGTPFVNCVQCGAAIPDEIVRLGPPMKCPRCG